jgi:hypothetical protein
MKTTVANLLSLRRNRRGMACALVSLLLILALAASTLHAGRRDHALISVGHTGGEYWNRLSLRIEITTKGRAWEFKQSDLRRESNGHMTTGEVETPLTGTAFVRFWVQGTDGTTVSEGLVELPLKPDWRWEVILGPSIKDPLEGCFGCFGSKAFPLHAAYRFTAEESFWVSWGGNSIKHPVVY